MYFLNLGVKGLSLSRLSITAGGTGGDMSGTGGLVERMRRKKSREEEHAAVTWNKRRMKEGGSNGCKVKELQYVTSSQENYNPDQKHVRHSGSSSQLKMNVGSTSAALSRPACVVPSRKRGHWAKERGLNFRVSGCMAIERRVPHPPPTLWRKSRITLDQDCELNASA